MVSTSGHRLIEEEAIASLVSDLLPRARVITPNIPEAEILLGGEQLALQKDLPDAARRLADKCGASVLLKAGHLTEEKLVDIFYDVEDGKVYELPSARIHTRNTHGTGCTLSSAFASMLAKGMSLPDAAAAAKDYINEAIIAGAEYEIGHGFGPVKHFTRFGMKVKVNNKPVETAASTLKELAEQLGLPEKGVAVAVDSKMIPRNEWAECAIAEGDNIIVIRASCGG